MADDVPIVKAADLMGYRSLKPLQEKAIEEFISGNDTFIVLPTGYGKTCCYACLPLVCDIFFTKPSSERSIILVVSPLTALIKDQVAKLTDRGTSAGYVDAESDLSVKENVYKAVYSILFMSPELLVDKWRSLFASPEYQKRLIGVIVDEAHCVVKW